MVYIVKAQSFNNPKVYGTFECEDFQSYVETIVFVAQTRRKGAKMRLMDVTENAVRFDVQRTKVTE